MGFYLQTPTEGTVYISNSYLKQKLLDYSANSNDSPYVLSEDAKQQELFLERCGVPTITLTSESCAKIIINNIDKSNIDKLSAIVALDKPHIIAIAYLMRIGIMSSKDLIKFLEADSIYTRDARLLRYLESDDQGLDIFAGLKHALSDLPRVGTQKNKDEIRVADVENFKSYSFAYQSMSGTYIKFDNNGSTFKALMDKYVTLLNQPSIAAFMENLLDERLASWPNWIRKTISWLTTISIDLFTGNLINDIASYFGGWSFTGWLLTEIGGVFAEARIGFNTADVFNEFIKIASIECAKEKFERRESSKRYEPNSTYLTTAFKQAYANIVCKNLDKMSYFWKRLCKTTTDAGYNYLYYSILAVNFNSWSGTYDSASGNTKENFYKEHKNEITKSQTNYYEINKSNLVDGKPKLTDLFTNEMITYDQLKTNVFDKINNRIIVSDTVISKALLLVLKGNSYFKLFANSNSNIALVYNPKFMVEGLDDAVVVLSDDTPYTGSKWHKINNTGTSNFAGIVQGIIDGAMTDELRNLKTSDFSTVEDQVKRISLIKLNIAKSAFGGTNSMVDTSPLLLMAYELICTYLDFLFVGNAVYSPNLPLNTNILEKKYNGEEISLDNGKNISEADGYKDLIFTPAISTPMFNYYHLVYLIRESYLLVPAILNYSQDVQNLFMLACAYQQY